jgi:hypothetical protein
MLKSATAWKKSAGSWKTPISGTILKKPRRLGVNGPAWKE